ncbi:MAG: NAD(P)-dependent oxidoreductase [Promethearchaeota archaeon]|nr:MAG: NAD(P)-dependent oxidoreductase [Candidatus Lokiarchaeota archaeon]
MNTQTRKRILITGSDGFIGSHLKRYFENNSNFKVYGTTYFQEAGKNEVRLDVRNSSEFDKLWNKDIDFIIHTIGNMDITASEEMIYGINVGGTSRFVQWGLKHNCKHFIYLSSITVYGPLPIGQNRKEDSFFEYKTLMLYGRTKRDAERKIKNSGISYTILRLPAVLGEKDSQLSPSIIPKILNEEFFICGSEKKIKKVAILVVDNLGPIIAKILEKGPFNDEFNCCCSRISWTDFTKEYFKLLEKNYMPKKKSTISALWNLSDKDYLLLTSFSKWGADFSSQKLEDQIGKLNIRCGWKRGVKMAIKGYIEKHYSSLKEQNLININKLEKLSIIKK